MSQSIDLAKKADLKNHLAIIICDYEPSGIKK